MGAMSEPNHTEAQPDAAEQPCEDCATSGEKILGVLTIVFAVALALMAVDMITGGKVTGVIGRAREQVQQ
jgi:hypothetical protein